MVNECLPYDAVCSKMHFVSFCCAHMFQSEILTGCTRFGSNSIFCVNTRCVSAHVFDSDYNYGHIDVCLYDKTCACMTCRQIYIVQKILITRVCMANTYTCVCIANMSVYMGLYGKYAYECLLQQIRQWGTRGMPLFVQTAEPDSPRTALSFQIALSRH